MVFHWERAVLFSIATFETAPASCCRGARNPGDLRAFFCFGPVFRAPSKIAAIERASMPSKQRRLDYSCTPQVGTEDDSEEVCEDPTLSGGLSRHCEDADERQSLRSDCEREECEEDAGPQDQEEQEGEEDDDNDSDSSGLDSSDQDDAEKARNRSDGGTPGSSRRSRWIPISSANQRKRKEWVVISEIPKENRSSDAIHREICNMLAN